MLLAMVYYAVSGRHWFKGPRINVDFVNENGPQVLEGRSAGSDGGFGYEVGHMKEG